MLVGRFLGWKWCEESIRGWLKDNWCTICGYDPKSDPLAIGLLVFLIQIGK
jgi:hypothetical protein